MGSTATAPMLSLDAGLTHYLAEIRKFPMLRPDQESAYAKRWREHGDREAAYHLVTSHLRLVAKIAMRYRGYGLPIADIISEGNVGLMAGRETLRKIEFDSSKFITPEELDEIAKKYIGQDADISTLQQGRRRHQRDLCGTWHRHRYRNAAGA